MTETEMITFDNLRARADDLEKELNAAHRENEELKTKIEAYKQLPETLEEKLREKQSELERSEADLRRTRQEKHELRCRLADAEVLYLKAFAQLADRVVRTDDDEQEGSLENVINSLYYPADVIEAMVNRGGLMAFENAIEPVAADAQERLDLFAAFLNAADDAVAVAREPDSDD